MPVVWVMLGVGYLPVTLPEVEKEQLPVLEADRGDSREPLPAAPPEANREDSKELLPVALPEVEKEQPPVLEADCGDSRELLPVVLPEANHGESRELLPVALPGVEKDVLLALLGDDQSGGCERWL